MDLKNKDKQLRASFEQAAPIYQQARPDYPEALYEELIQAANLHAGDRLLEVGCATGKATLPLAKRGFKITCIELGAELAAAARQNLRGMDVDIVNQSFEEWQPEAEHAFDLVFAATAWKWMDPEVRYLKAWQSLRPGGHLAFWSAEHVFPDGGDPFFRDIQTVYHELGEGRPVDQNDWPRPGELRELRYEIEQSGLFEAVHLRHFDWERVYAVEAYIQLLETFSGHILMETWKRDKLFHEIRDRLNRRSDKSVRRHWGAVLHVARRKERHGLRGSAKR
ncbi:class I SAM-dependent methyltransferase [Paenibacillus sp. MWE-103]|uniref:Class I SAM-dependent methyltransferase n=1 Tax=Paenibacillus artemisiicola TaxID=1172618 RepID=A0ABS3W880_9BACL|nr:class I SAM-dependent methyltransferase [Paenibacillus artemisiicola]MBO7744519.1 class I SAM-dependent methyltransferase [Paenibacillus artemisiicola]